MADISHGSGSSSIAKSGTFPTRPIARPPSRSQLPAKATPPLPPEIEFLVQHGVSADQLFHILDNKPRDVETLDAVLAEGIAAEEQYYHALAQHLGCAYYVGEPPFDRDFDAVKGLRCGVGALAGSGGGPRAVIAPRAELVPRLIEMIAAGHLHPNSFAVASPQRFAALIRIRRGDEILADALARIPDNLSARRGLSGPQIATAGLAAIAALVLGASNIHALTGVASLALWLLFSASIVLRSAATVAQPDYTGSPLLSDDELPVYSVVIPVYREAEIIEDLIRALDAIDYPKSKLDIKLVAERRDNETLSRIIGLRLPARYELVVAPPGEPCTKPRALDIALATARGELIVVYDAEDVPSPGQLRLAASRFAAERCLDGIQARLTIRNAGDSWLSNGIMAHPPQAVSRPRHDILIWSQISDRGGAERANFFVLWCSCRMDRTKDSIWIYLC